MALLLFGATVGCGGVTTTATSRDGGIHGEVDEVSDGGRTSNCTKDSDCTAGQNGRCVTGRLEHQCSYDGCYVDGDCTGGGVCLCGRSAASSNGANHRTLKAGCRVDSDCGPNDVCSPSFDSGCGAYGGTFGYFCHTPEDTCANDSEFMSEPGGYCAFDYRVGKWACGCTQCAG